VCMYIARDKTDYSLEEIGNFLGGRDHTTVIYAIEKIKSAMVGDPKLIDTVENIKNLLPA
jgi:chromosomal replication initiator protein